MKVSFKVLAEKDIESALEFFEIVKNFQSSSFFTDFQITTSETIDKQNRRERRAILTNITKLNAFVTGYRDYFLVSLRDNRTISNLASDSVDASLLMKSYQLLFEVLEKRREDLMRILLFQDQFIVFATRKLLLDWIFVADLHYYQTKKDTLSSLLSSFTRILWRFFDEINDPNNIKDSNKSNHPRYYLAVNAILEIYHQILKDYRKRLRSQLNVKDKGYVGGRIDGENVAKQILLMRDIWKWIIEFIKFLNSTREKMTTSTANSENHHHKRLQDDAVDYSIVIVPIRRVLEILLLISKSADNDISLISTVLFSQTQYTLHLLTNLTPLILDKMLFSSYDEYTEFFYTPPSSQSSSLSQTSRPTIIYDRECLKRVSIIYMSSVIRLIDIFTEQKQDDEDNEDDGKTSNKILIDFASTINKIEIYKNYNMLNEVINTVKELLESSKLLSFISRLFGENDGDMISFILSMVQLATRFSKFEQRIEELTKDKKEKRFVEQVGDGEGVEEENDQDDERENDKDEQGEKKDDDIDAESNIEMEIELSSPQQKILVKFLNMFVNLRQVIESLMSKHLFPYNATSLVRRIKQVEETLINLFENENNNNYL
ncbi:4439_t:CDS:2 [Ambispora leptoticha]|uniref:4439_t:CDS:1 n=1 Tax=Ambispora leptoticha TaxID=144679 RepID=A0A9N8VZR1_9GLOM|nr:4439_t:CDS:2 [Ambispora leptoticha]